MPNPNSTEIQFETLTSIWEQYCGQSKTSRRLKAEQGFWRRWLLIGSIAALFATPFSKTFEKHGFPHVAEVLVVVATVLFSVVAWLNKEMLGDDSLQPWVRARQTSEGLKSLAFRFLGGVTPFTGADAARLALERASELVAKTGVAPDRLDDEERRDKLPPTLLSAPGYIQHRVEDQIVFYERAVEREKKIERRIINIGRWISLGVVVFGAMGAAIAKDWHDIWAPALGVASTMFTTQMTRARHRYLIDSYATAATKLKFARTEWGISARAPEDERKLVDSVESILGAENAGWVQQILLKPVVPDIAPPAVAAQG